MRAGAQGARACTPTQRWMPPSLPSAGPALTTHVLCLLFERVPTTVLDAGGHWPTVGADCQLPAVTCSPPVVSARRLFSQHHTPLCSGQCCLSNASCCRVTPGPPYTPRSCGEGDVLWQASPVSRLADLVLWSGGSTPTWCSMSRTVHCCPCVSDTVARCGTFGGCPADPPLLCVGPTAPPVRTMN